VEAERILETTPRNVSTSGEEETTTCRSPPGGTVIMDSTRVGRLIEKAETIQGNQLLTELGSRSDPDRSTIEFSSGTSILEETSSDSESETTILKT
jgi:hypothetical protein